MTRIGVDARELGGRPTGVGRYLRELLIRWQAGPEYAGAELMLLSPAGDPAVVSPGPGARATWTTVPGGGGTGWEQWALARAARAAKLDVLFSPAYTAPLATRVPSVVAMHDVSFAAHPEWFDWRQGLRLRHVARRAARRAHTVLTLTAFSAAEIRRYLGVDPARIRVVPLAVDYHDAAPPPATSPPPSPVVLFVGSIFERRNLPLLIDGVRLARHDVPGIRLEIIGDNRTTPRQDLAAIARDRGVADAVRLRDYVTDTDLEAAYASAGAFAYLSAYEGFGLPPLEAMWHRLPVVVLDTPVAREVYGGGAAYVPNGDAASLARTLTTLLGDSPARTAQIAAGDAQVARYHWQDTARATWDVLLDAAGRSPA